MCVCGGGLICTKPGCKGGVHYADYAPPAPCYQTTQAGTNETACSAAGNCTLVQGSCTSAAYAAMSDAEVRGERVELCHVLPRNSTAPRISMDLHAASPIPGSTDVRQHPQQANAFSTEVGNHSSSVWGDCKAWKVGCCCRATAPMRATDAA